MRIKDEDYGEMEKAMEDEVNQREAAMYASLNTADDGRYGKVKIEHEAPTTTRHKWK